MDGFNIIYKDIGPLRCSARTGLGPNPTIIAQRKSENIYFGADDCKLSGRELILSRSYLRFAKDKLRERKEMKRKDCSRLSHRRSRSQVGSEKSELSGE